LVEDAGIDVQVVGLTTSVVVTVRQLVVATKELPLLAAATVQLAAGTSVVVVVLQVMVCQPLVLSGETGVQLATAVVVGPIFWQVVTTAPDVVLPGVQVCTGLAVVDVDEQVVVT
jgi:hypothetical protein